MGAIGAALGHTTSLIIAGATGFFIFILFFYKRLTDQESTINRIEASRILLSYGFPLFLSIIIVGVISQVNNFLMAINIDAFNIGNYQAAVNFSVLVTFFTMPIGTVLFPLFSKFDAQDNNKLGMVYQNSVKYAALMTVPITTALILLAEPIVQIIYGNSYPQTASYLQLFCFNFFFIGLGKKSNAPLLTGQGKTKVIFLTNVLKLCIGLPLSFFLIPRYGIPGLILTLIITPTAELFYSLWWIKKNFGFTINWETSIKIYLSSIISFLLIRYILTTLQLQNWMNIIIGGPLFVILYLVLVLILKTLNIDDISDLKRILSAMGPLTPLFNIFLTFIERFIK
jgi:O-antigen/teichoic acid export membrane protein